MTPDRFHDGVFVIANRTNRASGRSFHIPAPTPFAVSVLRCIPAFICAAVFCASVVAIFVMVAS